MSGNIFTIGFSYVNEKGNKKDKRGKKPEIPAFLLFLPLFVFFASFYKT
jgi:hypothetical protein